MAGLKLSCLNYSYFYYPLSINLFSFRFAQLFLAGYLFAQGQKRSRTAQAAC